MKKIAISGVTGFIGYSLCLKFLDMGYNVIGIGRQENDRIKKINNKNFTFMLINKMDESIFKDTDIFYHFAWNMNLANTSDYTLAWQTELTNLKMTCETLDFVIKAGVKKIVFCGSISQEKYRFDDNRNFTDIKGSIYGMAKQFASDIWRKVSNEKNYKFNTVLLANTYGPNDYSNKAVNQFIKKMVKNESLNLIEPNDGADWVYIDDTINGLIAIGEKGLNLKTYYLGHRNIRTFKEYILDLKNVLNSSSELNFGVYHEVMGYDYSKIDLNALYNDTGFECKCNFKESILKTKEWLEKEKKI